MRSAALVLALTLGCSTMALAAETAPDEAYLNGYLTSYFDHDLHWDRSSYTLDISSGIATITLLRNDAVQRGQAATALPTVDGILNFNVVLGSSTVDVSSRSAAAPRSGIRGYIPFPVGDVFTPILADPKQQQFAMSFLGVTTPNSHYTAWNVAFGETFGFMRWPGRHPGDGWQWSLPAGLFAQFDWSKPSKDLLNADYTFGTSLSYRHSNSSARFRFFHQSSHLGDEFLLANPGFNRIDLSFETFDLLLSQEWKGMRVYGGAGRLVDVYPSSIKPGTAQGGAEWIPKSVTFGFARPVIGVDLKWAQEQEWYRGISVKAGLELGNPVSGGRKIRFLGEYYDGYFPYGQFFQTKVHYAGGGLYLSL